MKVKWLGHASFLLTSDDGTRVVIDPYGPVEGLNYDPINETAEIVTVSHGHGDHNNVAAVKGNPEVVEGAGVKLARGIEFTGISTSHDTTQGSERGANTIFCFALDGVMVCHLGDLGHRLSDADVAQIGKVDVLLTPVGGHFTIDAAVATETCNALKPRVVVPMHFRTDKCAYPIADVEPFLEGRSNVRRAGDSEIELNKEKLPQATETVVLDHAM